MLQLTANIFEEKLAYLNNAANVDMVTRLRPEDCAEDISQTAIAQGRLTADALYWFDQGAQHTLSLADVVGASLCEYSTPNALPCFVVHTYPLLEQKQRMGLAKKRRRVLKTYVFACPSAQACAHWVKAIHRALRGVPLTGQAEPHPRRFHIFLNPNSGKKQARQIFQQIKPLLEKSNLSFTLIETTHPGHGFESIQTMDLAEIDGLVVIGGDGTLHEVINGLMNRADWETAIQTPLGVIPAGSGNGLCKTLLERAGEPYDPISAAFLIAKGRKQAFDLVEMVQNGDRYYSFLSLEWAIASDVDIGSEHLRYLGSLRHTIQALICILRGQTYKGRFSFLPAHNLRFPSSNITVPTAQNSSWQVIEDDFVLFWAMNIKWAAHDMKMAPHAALCDGAIDVIVIRQGISRLQLLRAFLKTYTGEYVDMEHIEYYKVLRFSLVPLTPVGLLAVDGEQVGYSPIQATVQKGLACILG